MEKEIAEIKTFPFDQSGSIDILLTKILTHSELYDIAGDEMIDSQIINLAYFIINKTPTYKQALI